MPSGEVEQTCFAVRPRMHALALLRCRLRGLFGQSFRLEVQSDVGKGSTAIIRIPAQTPFGMIEEFPREQKIAKRDQRSQRDFLEQKAAKVTKV
jgi:hypothetical protein